MLKRNNYLIIILSTILLYLSLAFQVSANSILPVTQGFICETNQPTAPDYVNASGANQVHSSTYDKEHNRVNYDIDGFNKSYTVNSMNQYTDVSGQTLLWDNNGNLTNDGRFKYITDAENRLIEIRKVSDNALVVNYFYDAQNRRIAKVFPDGKKVLYYYDQNWNLTDVYNSNNELLREFVYADAVDKPITSTVYLDKLGIDSVVLGLGSSVSSLNFYYHCNTLGNVLALTDTTGAVICRYKYSIDGTCTWLDKDGVEITDEGVLENFKKLNEKLWEARELDYESNLYGMRNRYYSSELGRFLTTDKLDYADGSNLYAYCNANYVNLTDPLGLYSVSEFKDDIYHGVRGAYLMDKEYREAQSKKPLLERAIESTPILGMAYSEGKDALKKYESNRDAGMGMIGSLADAGIQKANEMTGGQAILEGSFGMDRETGKELSGFDRGMKFLQGASQLALTALGATELNGTSNVTKEIPNEIKNWKIGIGAELSSEKDLIGHAFIKLESPSGRNITRGFWPKKASGDIGFNNPKEPIRGMGSALRDDSEYLDLIDRANYPKAAFKEYNISGSEAGKALAKIREFKRSIREGMQYQLFNQQCATFADDVLKVTNVNAPNAGLIRRPSKLFKSIQEMNE